VDDDCARRGKNTIGPMTTDRRSELADFLRGRRMRATPAAAGLTGLPDGRKRRTPGLRREEVAQLAGLSVDWYARLEQGRDVNPSRETLLAIARVLGLDDDERGHLFYLARAEYALGTPQAAALQETAEPAMLSALESMSVPALVLSPRFDVLAWNAEACRLLVPFDELPQAQRNILWLTFRHSGMRALYMDIETIERETVSAFRLSASAYVGDPHFDALIADLLETSETFRTIWADHCVRGKNNGTKNFRIDGQAVLIDWYSLASTTGTKQRLAYYVPRPHAPSPARSTHGL